MSEYIKKHLINNLVTIGSLYLLQKIWGSQNEVSTNKKLFHTALVFFSQYLYCTLRYGCAMSKISQLYYINKPKIIYYKQFVAPGYEPVLKLLKKQMEEGQQIGVQCCAYVKGQKVVDLCAHYVNNSIAPNLTYNDKSLQCVFSSGKSVEAMVVAWLVDQKKLSYHQKISHYWPEFGQNGKQDITIADLIKHEAGLPFFESKDIPMENLKRENIRKNLVAQQFEKRAPNFDPKTPRTYHPITRGLILNEIVRRVDAKQRMIGEIIQEEFCGPLNIDYHVSVPENHLSRCSDLFITSHLWAFLQSFVPSFLGRKSTINPLYWIFIALVKTPLILNNKKSQYNHSAYNTKLWRTTEMSSANSHATAEALAQLANIMAQKGQANGKQIISKATWDQMHELPTVQKDAAFYYFPTKFTQGGFNIYDKEQFLGRDSDSREGFCGWQGYGGAILRWHRDLEIGFGYCMNLMEQHSGNNVKGVFLQKKVYECATKLQK